MGSGSSCLTDRPSDFGAPPKTSDAFSRCPSRMPEQLRLTVRPIGRKDPISLFRRLHRGRWPFFLDSSLPDPELARYSFLGSDPVGWFRSRGPRAAYASPWGESSDRKSTRLNSSHRTISYA